MSTTICMGHDDVRGMTRRQFLDRFGMGVGSLALADLIGLDTLLHIMTVLHEGLGDDKYAPAPLLTQMVTEGKLGRKSGQGFYSYE